MSYFGLKGMTVISSVVGSVNTDFFVLMGEFGWIGALVFYGFYAWVIVRLVQKSWSTSASSFEFGFFIAMACCLIFLAMVTTLTGVSTVPALAFPLWVLIGRSWDMRPKEAPSDESAIRGA